MSLASLKISHTSWQIFITTYKALAITIAHIAIGIHNMFLKATVIHFKIFKPTLETLLQKDSFLNAGDH